MAVISFLSLGGQELTEQGRKMTDNVNVNASVVELDNGVSRRYIKRNKRSFTFTWDWLPSVESHTIDNRKARNYIKNLVFSTRAKVLMSIKLDHQESAESIYVYINDYSEDLIRRDPTSACDYYAVTLTVEEA
jgi:hypothetical protein